MICSPKFPISESTRAIARNFSKISAAWKRDMRTKSATWTTKSAIFKVSTKTRAPLAAIQLSQAIHKQPGLSQLTSAKPKSPSLTFTFSFSFCILFFHFYLYNFMALLIYLVQDKIFHFISEMMKFAFGVAFRTNGSHWRNNFSVFFNSLWKRMKCSLDPFLALMNGSKPIDSVGF